MVLVVLISLTSFVVFGFADLVGIGWQAAQPVRIMATMMNNRIEKK